jgi:hypothetical protein
VFSAPHAIGKLSVNGVHYVSTGGARDNLKEVVPAHRASPADAFRGKLRLSEALPATETVLPQHLATLATAEIPSAPSGAIQVGVLSWVHHRGRRRLSEALFVVVEAADRQRFPDRGEVAAAGLPSLPGIEAAAVAVREEEGAVVRLRGKRA